MGDLRFSAALLPAWRKVTTIAAAPNQPPVVQFLRALQDAIAQGDAAEVAARPSDAVVAWRSARMKILSLLVPELADAATGSDDDLPSGPDVEHQMSEAALRVLDALRTAAMPSTSIVEPQAITLPARLERVRTIGFRSASSPTGGSPPTEIAPIMHAAAVGRPSLEVGHLPLEVGHPPVEVASPAAPSFSLEVRRGDASAVLRWEHGTRPSAETLIHEIYEPRRTSSSASALTVDTSQLVELATQLPYLYAFALPRRIGDGLRASGAFASADAAYQIAARFGFLNHDIEGVAVWAAIAGNLLAWGDALYRAEDLAGCRERYGAIVTADGAVPGNSSLYTDPALASGAAMARRVISALDAPPSDIDPAIAFPILRAAMRWSYLATGLDFYGTDFTPIFTFSFLQDAARQFASRAIQAERDYIQFQTQAEHEAATRRELEQAIAAAQAERDGRRELLDAARHDRESLAAAASLARLRATQAKQDRDNYADAGYWQYKTQSIATAHGAGVDWHGKEIRELAADIEAGKWQGDYGKLAAAATLLGGEKSYEYQLARLDMVIAEANSSIPIADAQAAAAVSRERAASLALAAANQQLSFATGTLAALDAQVFTPQTWSAMAAFMRDLSASYFEWAIRTAKLMERAYRFENDSDVSVIRNNYAPSMTGGLLAGDALLRDIESFTYLDITSSRTKETQVKDEISLANDYPFGFAELLRSGRMSFETVLHDFDRRHPGLYGQRLAAVELEVVGMLPSEGICGTLSAGGVSRFRTRDGGDATRVHAVDTMALSEHSIRNDGVLYRNDGRRNGLFEGMGPATTWILDIPRRSNNLDYRLISDVRVILYYVARYDAALRDQVEARPPLQGEMIHARSFVLRYDFPEIWYQLLDTGVAELALSQAYLPRNETGFTVDNLALQVVTRAGVAPTDLRVRLTPPGGTAIAATPAGDGMTRSDPGQPLAGTIGAPLVGTWQVALERAGDGTPAGEEAVEDMLLLVQYRFAWPA